MNFKKLATAAAVSAALSLTAGTASAGLTLTLSDGLNSVSVIDGGVGDMMAGVGAVGWVGTLGNWYLNVSTGISNSPAIGVPASLHLNSVDASSTAGGTLTIKLEETGLTSPAGTSMGLKNAIGGVSAGTMSFTSQFNGTTLATYGPFGVGAFAVEGGATVDTSAPFSVTQIATITHTGMGISSFDFDTKIPEPATLGLLGLGLFGLGAARRKAAAK